MSIGASQPSRTLLVSPQYVLDNSPINQNVEQKIIAQSIRRAEDVFLMPLIGSPLYESIIGRISGGTMPASAYKDLLDLYIAPCLVEYSVLEYIPYSAMKMRNKGIQRQTGDNSEPVAVVDLSYLTNAVKDSAQFYSTRLIKYLLANLQTFPEYATYTTTIDSVPPAGGDYFNGIEFNTRKRNPWFGMGTSTDYSWF